MPPGAAGDSGCFLVLPRVQPAWGNLGRTLGLCKRLQLDVASAAGLPYCSMPCAPVGDWRYKVDVTMRGVPLLGHVGALVHTTGAKVWLGSSAQ